jgi:hypothetical protein
LSKYTLTITQNRAIIIIESSEQTSGQSDQRHELLYQENSLSLHIRALRTGLQFAEHGRYHCLSCDGSGTAETHRKIQTLKSVGEAYDGPLGPSEAEFALIMEGFRELGIEPKMIDSVVKEMKLAEDGEATRFAGGEVGPCISPEGVWIAVGVVLGNIA